jgi:hypothetical protein
MLFVCRTAFYNADAAASQKMKKVPFRNRRIGPSLHRTYLRLHDRVDRLEDAINYFYNVINELRRRVSTLEKKLNPLAKD